MRPPPLGGCITRNARSSVRPLSVPCPPLSRKRKTIRRSNLEENLPSSGITAEKILRSKRQRSRSLGTERERAAYRISNRPIYWPQTPRLLLAVPNVTAHPSAANVPITALLYDGPLLCGFSVGIKGLMSKALYVPLSLKKRSRAG